jgi:hypothetical protein
MYLLDDSKCAAGPIAPTPAVGLDHDRRRPGRIHEMNPALIPLLRNPVEVVIVNDIISAPPGAINAALQKTSWIWVLLVAWLSIVEAIRLVTGNGSLIALLGVLL